MNLANKFLFILKLFGVWIGSWIIGGFVATFIDVWHPPFQAFNLEWFIEALAWTFATAFLGLFVILIPAMFLLRRVLHGTRPIVLFPIVAFIASFILTTFFYFSNKFDWLTALLSFQSLPYHVLFSLAGVLFALGFVWCARSGGTEQLVGPERR